MPKTKQSKSEKKEALIRENEQMIRKLQSKIKKIRATELDFVGDPEGSDKKFAQNEKLCNALKKRLKVAAKYREEFKEARTGENSSRVEIKKVEILGAPDSFWKKVNDLINEGNGTGKGFVRIQTPTQIDIMKLVKSEELSGDPEKTTERLMEHIIKSLKVHRSGVVDADLEDKLEIEAGPSTSEEQTKEERPEDPASKDKKLNKQLEDNAKLIDAGIEAWNNREDISEETKGCEEKGTGTEEDEDTEDADLLERDKDEGEAESSSDEDHDEEGDGDEAQMDKELEAENGGNTSEDAESMRDEEEIVLSSDEEDSSDADSSDVDEDSRTQPQTSNRKDEKNGILKARKSIRPPAPNTEEEPRKKAPKLEDEPVITLE